MKTQKMIIKQGIVGRDNEGPFQYFGWPTVCKDENDVLYAVVSKGMAHICPFGHNVLYTSHDGGETWSEPNIIVDDIFDDRDAGICYLGNGKMIMSYFTPDNNRFLPGGSYKFWMHNYVNIHHWCSEELRDETLAKLEAVPEDKRYGGSYVRLSEDYGKTWGDAIHIPLSCPHGPTLLRDGRILYVGTPHELEAYQKATGDTTEYKNAVCAIISEDGGKTWKKHSEIPMPKDWSRYEGGHYWLCEAHVIQRKNGHLVVAIRRGPNNEPLRRCELETVLLTYSQDGGKTWTIPVPVKNCDGEILSGAPAHLMEMEDGGIVMSYSRRTAPCGNRAMISYDGGYTWGEEIILSTPWNPEDDDLGYPATAQLSNGDLVTVYYQRYLLDIRTSLLYTKWNPKK